MRIINKIKPLGFLVFLCVINLTLNFLLEPATGSSDTMWNDYYMEEDLNMVFVGSSVCSATFAPDIFNNKLEVNSINMGTPSQAIGQSLDALEVAFAEHDIEHVILGLDYYGLQEKPLDRAEMTFQKAHARKQGVLRGMAEDFHYSVSKEVWNKEKSLNYFFPWMYNHVKISAQEIAQNVMDKRRPTEEPFDESTKEHKCWILEKGYRPFTGELDQETIWAMNSYYYYNKKSFDMDAISDFKEIIKLCKDNDADILVINPPHPYEDVISCFEYYESMEKELTQLCEECEVSYYNFSLVKEELFDAKQEYFYDFEHLNYAGSQAFCSMLCDFIEKRDRGENVEQYFYTVDEYYHVHEEILEKWKATYEPK